MAIVSIKDYKEHQKSLINSIKEVSASVGNGWMTSGRVSDEIYCSNDLKILMGRKNSDGKAL